MTAIHLEKISKSWQGFQALSDISFNVPPSSFTVLLGPSGCGKSTLLRMVAGLEYASAGSIHIGGKDVTSLAPAQRNLSMVFQSYALFPHLNVSENILFGLKVRKVKPTDQQQKLRKVADLLGLSSLLQRKPSQLSGGQQQRVAMARAIISEAPVCLMDEPMSNLDAQLRNEMRMEIHNLQQKLGITMLYVTHDQVEAMTMADQIVLLNGGRIEQVGSPTDMYNKPASIFAAKFIGTPPMNVFQLSEPVINNLDPETTSKIHSKDELLIGLRPEEIKISDAGLIAKVVGTEYLGADILIHCAHGNDKILVRQSRGSIPHINEEIKLNWRKQDVHFFSKSTGLNHNI